MRTMSHRCVRYIALGWDVVDGTPNKLSALASLIHAIQKIVFLFLFGKFEKTLSVGVPEYTRPLEREEV